MIPLRRPLQLVAVVVLLWVQAACEKSPPPPNEALNPATPATIVGRVVKFTADSERYRVEGWRKTEGDFAWTGTSATLALPISAEPGPLSLTMTLRGLVKPPDLAFQPVEVRANNQKIADWQVADTAAFTAEIPPDVIKSAGETLNIYLRIPKAISPAGLGMHSDQRTLGVCCYSIELKKTPSR